MKHVNEHVDYMQVFVYDNKQRWNKDKYRCECKELIDKEVCDKGFVQNPSNCECECDKSCEIGKYLDYENCKCRKRLGDKLVEQCTENVDDTKIAEINLFGHEKVFKSSCAIYVSYL